MTKKRKFLDDSLANEFVFGGSKPEIEAAPTLKVEEEEVTAEEESAFVAPTIEKKEASCRETK